MVYDVGFHQDPFGSGIILIEDFLEQLKLATRRYSGMLSLEVGSCSLILHWFFFSSCVGRILLPSFKVWGYIKPHPNNLNTIVDIIKGNLAPSDDDKEGNFRC